MLKNHYVAFIDLLGFSDMVAQACNSSDPSHPNLRKLLTIHQETISVLEQQVSDAKVTQFSDSTVVSMPFSSSDAATFVGLIANLQLRLFHEGVLCRGGMVVGKHYSEDSFTFSMGLIDAYHLESSVARFPRIVVSKNLLDLLDDSVRGPLPLLTEADGLAFVDYLKQSDLRRAVEIVEQLRARSSRAPSSVHEKLRWLRSYVAYHCQQQGGTPAYSRQPDFAEHRG